MKNYILFGVLLVLFSQSVFSQFGKFGELNIIIGTFGTDQCEDYNFDANYTLSTGKTYKTIFPEAFAFSPQIEYTRGFVISPRNVVNIGSGYMFKNQEIKLDAPENSRFEINTSPHFITVPIGITHWFTDIDENNGEIVTGDDGWEIFGIYLGLNAYYRLGSSKIHNDLSNYDELSLVSQRDYDEILIISEEVANNVNRLILVSRFTIRALFNRSFTLNFGVTCATNYYNNDPVNYLYDGNNYEFKMNNTDGSFKWGLGVHLSFTFKL